MGSSFPTQSTQEFPDSPYSFIFHQCSFRLVYPHLPAALRHYILVSIHLDEVGNYSDLILLLYR